MSQSILEGTRKKGKGKFFFSLSLSEGERENFFGEERKSERESEEERVQKSLLIETKFERSSLLMKQRVGLKSGRERD